MACGLSGLTRLCCIGGRGWIGHGTLNCWARDRRRQNEISEQSWGRPEVLAWLEVLFQNPRRDRETQHGEFETGQDMLPGAVKGEFFVR